ncbi:hypothetical protein BE17_37210 [Sorangium cellulosum]|uniref:Uncharacterized protein n=1 Tax=Sorangium cellulosum TaxID=56 RepID=A0A150SGC9_SORCE|nr:hypothetical protein BE17_37210 [Sorangium cellulosum]
MKTECLHILFACRDSLGKLIIHMTPGDGEIDDFDRLVQCRDRVSAIIGAVIAKEFKSVTEGLMASIDQLATATAKLGKVQQTIEGTRQAIQIADEVIKLVIQILAVV